MFFLHNFGTNKFHANSPLVLSSICNYTTTLIYLGFGAYDLLYIKCFLLGIWSISSLQQRGKSQVPAWLLHYLNTMAEALEQNCVRSWIGKFHKNSPRTLFFMVR